MDFTPVAFHPCDILLPAPGIAYETWSCVACDQYTSQPEYWANVAASVGDRPSTLQLMLPECYLSNAAARVPDIHRTMAGYLDAGTLTEQVTDGFVLLERTTQSGCRIGLMGAVDLDSYSFEEGAQALIRPTEQTIRSRLPARLQIRQGAPVELSHIMMLSDDPQRTVIEPLYARRDTLRLLYDFDLMGQGGHLRGWAVDSDADKQSVLSALTALKNAGGDHPLLFAVGDGNHSLATAKAAWDTLKPTLTPAEAAIHPARFALAEVVNIHCEALNFEPIHRVLTHVDPAAVLADWRVWCQERGMSLCGDGDGDPVTLVWGGMCTPVVITDPIGSMPADTLQQYLDDYLSRHSEAAIDYIHGDDVVMSLTRADDAMGFLLPPLEKGEFFAILDDIGVMPRKTFSLGEANEKRFYTECRRIL